MDEMRTISQFFQKYKHQIHNAKVLTIDNKNFVLRFTLNNHSYVFRFPYDEDLYTLASYAINEGKILSMWEIHEHAKLDTNKEEIVEYLDPDLL
jgi:hypothetical protein